MTEHASGRPSPGDQSLQEWLKGACATVGEVSRFRRRGRVDEIAGLTVVSNGPPAQVGELCTIEIGSRGEPVRAQVVGFRGTRVLLMPLGKLRGVEPGCSVLAAGQELTVPAGDEMMGRIVDAFGEPIDGRGPVNAEARRRVHADSPDLVERSRVKSPLRTGVRAIDLLLTCGKGQRLGIFAGSGVGKSALIGMIGRNSAADVNVIALVGERGREVLDFVGDILGPALEKSVVVAATADKPALVRLQAGFAATSIAEHFRDQGADVLLMMDSITRLARAQREVGLAVGEMPASRGYPPSVYEMIPRLVERVGPSVRGTITGIYTVLVEGDDMLEPVADTVRATLDGHVNLSRQLAQRGQYPAVDVTGSLSRLMERVVDDQHLADARVCRRLLQAHQEIADLLSVGAYEPGGDRWTDAAVQLAGEIENLLCQDVEQPPGFAQARAEMGRIARRAREMV